MKILVLNAGSSSLKLSVFDTQKDDYPIFKAQFEKFENGTCVFSFLDQKRTEKISSTEDALSLIPVFLRQFGHHHFDAVGHRVAHGGGVFSKATCVTDEILKQISAFNALAPLHNPINLKAIEMSRDLWSNISHFAVFDSAFHGTTPPHAYTYAIPKNWREKGVRRYGFHGIAHRYASDILTKKIKKNDLKIINCHLGSGASLCAIKNGQSIDTSMGFTPLEGLVMGERCGDLDPGIFNYLHDNFSMTAKDFNSMLYKQSGLKAICGLSDMRSIEEKYNEKNLDCALAISIYVYRIQKYIGSYLAALEGIDVLSFTGGVGENSSLIRRLVCEKFSFLDLDLDPFKNENTIDEKIDFIHNNTSKIKVAVIKCFEDYMIAHEIKEYCAKEK
jgi:acetate kinase